jgi:hypothetical protein
MSQVASLRDKWQPTTWDSRGVTGGSEVRDQGGLLGDAGQKSFSGNFAAC